MPDLTQAQLLLLDKLGIRRRGPSGTQTAEQALSLNVASFRHACALEAIGVPSEADVLAELGRPPSKADSELIEALYPPGGSFGH
jgi:hypothetical protein